MILALVLSALAVPPLTGPVVDEAHVLSATEAARLDDLARIALAQGGPQLGFLIVPSLEGEAIEDYSIRVAEKWKLGTAAKDNGLLFVVAVQDHRMRIEVGGGLEGEITDAQSGRIIHDTLAPAFRAGQYGPGLYDGARQALSLAGVDTPGAPVARPTYRPVRLPFFPIVLFLLFFFFSHFRTSPARHLLGRPLDRRRRFWRGTRRRRWRRLGRRRRRLLRRRFLRELVMELFDKAQQARIAAAVATAEATSRGEIVPAVVPRSAAYLEALDRGGIAGVLLASALYLGIQTGWSEPTAPTLLLAQALGFLVGWLLAHVPALARLLVGRKSMDTAVRWRAEVAFSEYNLTATRESTGILLFASLFERQVVVLADKGIHEKVGQEPWSIAVTALVTGMRRGDPTSGFIDAIGLVGDELARHFPRGPDDVNELPDSLRQP